MKTNDGRESVEALLLDAERHMADDEQMGDVSLDAIKNARRRLGLDKAPANKANRLGKKERSSSSTGKTARQEKI